MHMRPYEKPRSASEPFFRPRLFLHPNLKSSTFHLRNEHYRIGAEFAAFEMGKELKNLEQAFGAVVG
jgi:hypothetical protein